MDQTNIDRIANGSLSFDMPVKYETSNISWSSRTATRTFSKKLENLTKAEQCFSFGKLHPSLLWLARTLMYTGDSVDAALAGIPVQVEMDRPKLYAVLDELIATVRQRLESKHDRGAEHGSKNES